MKNIIFHNSPVHHNNTSKDNTKKIDLSKKLVKLLLDLFTRKKYLKLNQNQPNNNGTLVILL